MKTPRININLANIEANARRMKMKCNQYGIKLTGVVKGAAGEIEIVKAFTKGGINSLGDSRLKNIKLFRKAGFNQEIVLLRLPQPNEVKKIVEFVDISLVSEKDTILALGQAATTQNKIHGIIIMVDVGDLREGILPEKTIDFFNTIIKIQGIEIKGIGTNVGCYGGVLPSKKNTKILIDLKNKIEDKFNLNLSIISGGNTATTTLLSEGTLPHGINNLRIGEAILQGTNITQQHIIKDLNQNNFTMTAKIIELKEKPSVPTGKIGHDAFGNKPQFEDKGIRQRAILAVGRQDIKINGITPLIKGAKILGASSDHLLLDVAKVKKKLRVGSEINFKLDYGALLAAMTSDYIHKNYIE